jgi:hypothetical protein
MQHKINWCYLCQSTEKLTSDHLPPKNLFPKPKPTNLITVPCCASCNGGFSKLDEQFRVFVSMPVNVSSVGNEIKRKKVFGGSLKDSPRLKKQMARNLFKGTLTTELGPITAHLIAMDRDVIDRFLTRLTKGLLATFYSDINYFDLQFGVTQLNQFGANHPTFKAVTSILTADQRGDGVFRFWHGVTNEDRTTGVWIYQFYDAALFMVRHSKDLSLELSES